MTTIFDDAFTQVATVTLDAHVPTDAGDSWTQIWESAADTDINAVSGDTCQQETKTDAGTIYTADATYDSSDYYIQCTMNTLDVNTTKSMFLMVRIQDVDNMYAVRIHDQGGTGTCQLYKKVAGSWSTLGSAFDPPANGSVIKLEIVGSVLKFYDDGVEDATATDGDITAAGKAGIGGGGGAELVSSTDDMSTSNVLDNLTIVTTPVANPLMVSRIINQSVNRSATW